MRIAIEIDNIIRDNNSQALKYYKKGIDNFFDEDVDMNCSDLLSRLPFESKDALKTFRNIDYPYELFGCASTCRKHLHVEVKDWLDEHKDDEIVYFALNESNLVIQSTYFFLSKGSKVREVVFPKKAEDIWNYCDMAITINDAVVDSKPIDKSVIVIRKTDNEKLQAKADGVYDNVVEALYEHDFKATKEPKKQSWIKRIMQKIF